MNNDSTVVIIIFALIAISSFLIGYIVKKYKMADIISGYDSSRDNPEVVCKLMGDNMMLMGIAIGILTVAFYFFKNEISAKLYTFTNIAIIILLCINIYYRWNKNIKNKL